MNKIPNEVEPLKNIKDIEKIKQYLKGKDNKRDYTIFTVGINVGLRAGDLLSLKWEDVLEGNTIKDTVYIKEEKTDKNKAFDLNKSAKDALRLYLNTQEGVLMGDYIFKSRKGDDHLQVRSLHKIINTLVRELKIKGNYGTHSLRKTFGYHRYINNVKLETLQKIFNHSTQAMTLKYIGITREVIQDAYNMVNL
ncbi:phage integrase family protein [Natranaerovirga pectinivora]|uniref:Phage integrase family protein n=1 Tax=Natranaerovirga pectinivora TaxID=682400 RepID=A0A4R3MN23_9FIRM|nr:tyrosine-type recombinase/integrase [Natranaerovirga pectinivora]TCT16393.1 phage integrase family protein [Natranaerovirga pectinivora]